MKFPLKKTHSKTNLAHAGFGLTETLVALSAGALVVAGRLNATDDRWPDQSILQQIDTSTKHNER